jgi:Cilia- and flagella-associated protein 298
LWFAGKQMQAANTLSVHVGRHEKTKVVVKLQQQGQGAPSREAV